MLSRTIVLWIGLGLVLTAIVPLLIASIGTDRAPDREAATTTSASVAGHGDDIGTSLEKQPSTRFTQAIEVSGDSRAGVMAAFATAVEPGAPERQQLEAGLAASGKSSNSEPWMLNAVQFFQGWAVQHTDISQHLQIVYSACYRGGCYFEMEYRDFDSFMKISDSLNDLKQLNTWPGGRIEVSPEVLPSGMVRNAWILLRPEAST